VIVKGITRPHRRSCTSESLLAMRVVGVPHVVRRHSYRRTVPQGSGCEALCDLLHTRHRTSDRRPLLSSKPRAACVALPLLAASGRMFLGVNAQPRRELGGPCIRLNKTSRRLPCCSIRPGAEPRRRLPGYGKWGLGIRCCTGLLRSALGQRLTFCMGLDHGCNATMA